MRGMETFTLVPRGPFSLAASIRFLEGFTPASYSSAPDGVLELAFPAEGSWRTVGVRVSQAGETVNGEIVSPAAPEAAAWTIIGHRIRITQAAALKARIAERLGEPVSFRGRVVHAFPSPQQLAKLDTFPGLAGRKPEWLRSLAQAALDGYLDAARLRAMPAEDALADLKKLPGIGDFSAGLTLLRGAGAPDAVPNAEPRLARAITLAYGLPGPATPEQVQQISENWRPYRTWVTLLLRTQLEDETGEITGRHGHARTG